MRAEDPAHPAEGPKQYKHPVTMTEFSVSTVLAFEVRQLFLNCPEFGNILGFYPLDAMVAPTRLML